MASGSLWSASAYFNLKVSTATLLFPTDFRPLWREHAPAAGERLHPPTLVAAGAAAFVVLAALALAATDPEAEDVVLDMFAGV